MGRITDLEAVKNIASSVVPIVDENASNDDKFSLSSIREHTKIGNDENALVIEQMSQPESTIELRENDGIAEGKRVNGVVIKNAPKF